MKRRRKKKQEQERERWTSGHHCKTNKQKPQKTKRALSKCNRRGATWWRRRERWRAGQTELFCSSHKITVFYRTRGSSGCGFTSLHQWLNVSVHTQEQPAQFWMLGYSYCIRLNYCAYSDQVTIIKWVKWVWLNTIKCYEVEYCGLHSLPEAVWRRDSSKPKGAATAGLITENCAVICH